jgi:hypothetical protein
VHQDRGHGMSSIPARSRFLPWRGILPGYGKSLTVHRLAREARSKSERLRLTVTVGDNEVNEYPLPSTALRVPVTAYHLPFRELRSQLATVPSIGNGTRYQ